MAAGPDDDTLWSMRDIAREFGVRYETVTRWRSKSRRRASGPDTGQPDRDALPAPVADSDSRPQWRPSEVRQWAQATGRMTPDGAPTHDPAPAAPHYEELVNDPGLWDMRSIAGALQVQYQTVKTWRRDALAATGKNRTPHPNQLPPPTTTHYGKPLWEAGLIRKWAMQTGRMTPDGQPQRSKPPGRPRGASTRRAAPTTAGPRHRPDGQPARAAA